MACTLKFTTPEVRCRKFYAKPNTPQQATGRGPVCSFRPKGLGICTSRHSPNIPLPVAGIKSFLAGNRPVLHFHKYCSAVSSVSPYVFIMAVFISESTCPNPRRASTAPLIPSFWPSFQLFFSRICICGSISSINTSWLYHI